MAELIGSFEWSQTPVGEITQWPQSLKSAVRIILGSRYPMFVWWGKELIKFYNDAYIPVLGKRHPSALGQPATQVWADIWNVVGPQADLVMKTGEASWNEEGLLIMERNGYLEETYFTYSYSPVSDDTGAINGVFCACSEETGRVLSRRRLRTLRELAASTVEAKTVHEACKLAVTSLEGNKHDIPFALVYLAEDAKEAAQLVCATGLERGTPAAPATLSSQFGTDSDRSWPLHIVLESGECYLVNNVPARFGSLPGGPWPEPVQRAMVCPLAHSGMDKLSGFLIVGLSPRLACDEDYRDFVNLLARGVATAMDNARGYEVERRRAEELAEIDRAKTAFFSNVSHEFRTPLTLLLGPVQEMLQVPDDGLNTRKHELLSVVHRNALRLQKLVNTLLDFSRLEAGRVEPRYELVDLAALTSNLASVFRSAIEGAGLRFTVDCPPLPKLVAVDQEMWEKIVLNLLSNALKFTLEGEISVSLTLSGDNVHLSVRDTGTGIPADQLAKIFERFHRVENQRGRTHEGTGIGLALVRELTQLQGGEVSVQSEEARGTVFLVSIPCDKKHLPPARTAPTTLQLGSGANHFAVEALRWTADETHDGTELHHLSNAGSVRSRILLADDNADMRRYVSQLLSAHFEVESVPDGLAALSAIRRQLPDLVLTDVMMPNLDGFGLVNTLRADAATRDIPIILLSARAGEESRIEGIEAGADDYLVKPFSARELLASVRARIELVQIRKESAKRESTLKEAAIRAENRATQILESITDAFYALDRDWRYTYVNRQCERYYGKTREELIGKVVWEVFPDALGSTFEKEFRRALDEGTAAHLEVESPVSHQWLDVHAYPSAEGLSIYFRNISNRKKIEQALRASEERFRRLAETSAFGLLIGDVRGGLAYANPTMLRTLGYTAEEFARGEVRWDRITPPEFADRDAAALQQLEQSGFCEPYEKVYLTRTGDRIPILLGASILGTNADGGVEVAVIVSDLTPLKRTEAALELERRRLQTIGERLEEALAVAELGQWELNLRTFTVIRSRRHDQIFGYADAIDDWDYDRFINHILPEDRAAVDEAYRDTLEKGTNCDLEFRIRRHSDGEIRWVWIRGTVKYGSSEQPERMLGTIADITERKRIEEALQEQAQALREADRRKDEFLAMLAHELRNPLASVLNATEVLNESNAEEDRIWATGVIQRQIEQLARIIDDLLDVSRITRGKIVLRKERLDAAVLLDRAAESVRPLITERHHTLVRDYPHGVLWVDADPTRFEQIVLNLLTNAAKYTEANGRIELMGRLEGEEVIITVRDNGIGVPPEKLPAMWELFAQGERSIARSEGGLGIGLTIVRNLVDLHGGSANAQSEGVGKGSVFTIRFPAAPTTQPDTLLTDSPHVAAQARPLRILVVDDNVDTVNGIRRLLTRQGHHVGVAHDGLSAIDLTRAVLPHVILLDIGLPGMDGYEVAAHIRKDSCCAGTVLIAISGYGQEEDRRRSHEAGFDHHFVKPVDFSKLKELLAEIGESNGL